MPIQPIEELATLPVAIATLVAAVVKVDGIAICPQRVATGKCDVADVALAFIRRLGARKIQESPRRMQCSAVSRSKSARPSRYRHPRRFAGRRDTA